VTGRHVETPDDQARAALALRDAGARAVLVKGGHVAGDMVTDVLLDNEGMHMFRTRASRVTPPMALAARLPRP